MSFAFCNYLVLVNLFIEISGNPLLGAALYEAFAAAPIIALSPLVLKVGRRFGVQMLVSGMLLNAASLALLAFAGTVEVALVAALMASVGFAVSDPFYMDVLFGTVPKPVRGTLLGSLASAVKLIGMAAPAISGYLASMDPHLPFAVASVATLASAALASAVASGRYRRQS